MIDIFTGKGEPLTGKGWANAQAALGLARSTGDATLWAILAVETRGFGFLSDRRPKILFERHIFHARTGGRFSAGYPDISNDTPGGYLGGADEYGRLKRAMLLDRDAALESASWGLGQIMGFNATSLGYDDAKDMVDTFMRGEDEQLDGCVRFIKNRKDLLKAVQAKSWKQVAFFYNGKSYAKNKYDVKLDNFYEQYTKPGASLPAIDTRAAQARLTYLGYNPKGIDGVLGNGTTAALKAFQAAYNATVAKKQKQTALNVIGTLDAQTAAALEEQAEAA